MTDFQRMDPSGADAPRRFERHPARNGVLLAILDSNFAVATEWWCRLVDISQGGVKLMCGDMPPDDCFVAVCIPNAAGTDSAVLFAKVTHVGAMEGEWSRVGARFAKVPPAAQPIVDYYRQRFGREAA
jgi:hypothetical protein